MEDVISCMAGSNHGVRLEAEDLMKASSPRKVVIQTAERIRLTGLCVSSLGNVSVRGVSLLWITPTRRLTWGLREEDVVVVQFDRADTACAAHKPSRELPLHLAIYNEFPAAAAVVHTHSPWATAWSHLGIPLPGGTEELTYHGIDSIPCSPLHPAGSEALANAACKELATANVALLQAHGVVAMASSATDALELCALAEQQAHIQWLLRLDSTQKPARVAGLVPPVQHSRQDESPPSRDLTAVVRGVVRPEA